jgi:hypothetical protein
MTKAGGLKSLKDEYRWQIWLILAFNSLFFYAITQENAIRFDGVRAAFTNADNLLPVGFALVAATVVNGLLSEQAKARVVFLRWRFPLPGHRAFSEHAQSDPRISLASLKSLCGPEWPTDPRDQNRIWYRMYKTVENEPAVRQVHRDFLLLRDYAGMSALFLLIYGAAGLYAIPSWKVGVCYAVLLASQFSVVRYSASNYGISFVKTVLAVKAATHQIMPG